MTREEKIAIINLFSTVPNLDLENKLFLLQMIPEV